MSKLNTENRQRRAKRRTCTSKIRYRSEGDALRAIRGINRKRDAGELYSYWCPYCDGYHLTHHNDIRSDYKAINKRSKEAYKERHEQYKHSERKQRRTKVEI
jgi:hypothetical protein